ncbi:MAG: hypothetical protein WBG46_13455 [Nonlabens sp.]
MKIIYPNYSSLSCPPLEVRIDGLRKGSIEPGQEIEIQYPEGKLISVKLGAIAKAELTGNAESIVKIKNSWYLRNISWINLLLILVISGSVSFIVDFNDEHWWLILLGYVVCLSLFYLIIVNSNMIKLEVIKIDP